MSAAKYDIYAEQGVSFKLHLLYTNAANNPISLSGFTGEMIVRDTATDPKIYLMLTNYGVTGGGITGDFDPTAGEGLAGVGGICFDTGTGGNSGVTGGILIKIDRYTMNYIPAKKIFLRSKINKSQ